MDTSQSLAEAKDQFYKAKADLIAEWKDTVDEAGTFSFVFGDPNKTDFAIRIEVGYDDNDEIYVDLFPESESSAFSDFQLNELESLVYSEAGLLDDNIAHFAEAVYDYLYGETKERCFLYDNHRKVVELEKKYKKKIEEDKQKKLNAEQETIEKKKSGYSEDVVWIQHWAAQLKQAHIDEDNKKIQKLMVTLREREQNVGENKHASKVPKAKPSDWQLYPELIEHMIGSFQLKTVIFSHTHKELTGIPLYISNLKHLQEANFGYNKLVVIPQELVELPYLRKLILCRNQLRFLPPLSGCPILEFLDCHSNEITELPSDIHMLQLLQTIDFERNKIVAIPDTIGQLKRLQYMGFTKNNIKFVPPQIGALENLTYLKLNHNPIVNLPAHVYLQGTKKTVDYLKEYIPEAAHITASSMVADLAKYANEEEFSDLILQCSTGQRHFAHRIMIAARCPLLYKAITDSESSEIVEKKKDNKDRFIMEIDVDEVHLQHLLTYIYGDVFTPEKPKVIEITPDMEPWEVEQVNKVNKEEFAKFSELCTSVSKMATRFELPRLAYLAEILLHPNVPAVASNYYTQFKPFCLKPNLSDVSFKIEGRTIKTHKLLICARSLYFKNMLTGGLLESTLDEIPFDDASYAVMKAIFEFCYTDDATITSEIVMDLLMSARVYGIERLIGIVETVVGYSLDVDNAPSIFSIAELYSFKRLGKACKYFIMANWASVLSGPAWQDLDESLQTKLFNKAKKWKII